MGLRRIDCKAVITVFAVSGVDISGQEAIVIALKVIAVGTVNVRSFKGSKQFGSISFLTTSMAINVFVACDHTNSKATKQIAQQPCYFPIS
jgi:ABC-type xylose transport system substrate-binding protein